MDLSDQNNNFNQVPSIPATDLPAENTVPPTPTPAPTVTPSEPSVTTNIIPPPSGGNGSKKTILATLGILLAVVGVAAGVYLVRNQQLGEASAWDCSKYNFALSSDGTVTVSNGQTSSEPPQQAKVYINNTLVNTFDVPRLDAGEAATLGTISVPQNQSYTWKVEGTDDCTDSGSVTVTAPTASCSAVRAYDEEWEALSSSELSALSGGDIVRFAVSGTASTGTFQKARFSVNGATAIESSATRPGTEEFYYEYTVPAGVTSFNVTAQIFHDSLGWF